MDGGSFLKEDRESNARGFSLVEMTIVMVIISIIGMIGYSVFTKHGNNRNLKNAASAYMSDIKLAKQKSMAEGVRYRITIHESGNAYTVQDCCDGDCSSLGCTYSALKSFDVFGSGVKIINSTYGGNTNTFQTRGTSSAGSLVLENSVGSKITIKTTTMGRIRSEENIK